MSGGPNTVELIGTYGGDLTIALSAWTSTSRKLTEKKRARIPALLKMLADSGHGTPFEKSSLHFLVTTDIATHIHLIKHRIGVSLNSESARYKELKSDKFYIPQDWSDVEVERYVIHMEESQLLYHETLERLIENGMDRKRAKESARLYLPYGTQITADVMFNFRSFFHFLGLRYSYHAQTEVRELAQKMLQMVIDVGDFKHTLAAYGLVDEEGKMREPFE